MEACFHASGTTDVSLSLCLSLSQDYSVLLIQLDGNLASDVSTRCSGRPQGNEKLVLRLVNL